MIIRHLALITFSLIGLQGCKGDDSSSDNANQSDDTINSQSRFADVIDISVNGNENNYRFEVTISSPDTGCEQYADYWEVVTMEGELIYRRILAHSHVNEQPFTRSGGPVQISADQEVWIRAHMNTSSYGGKVFKGSVSSGFEESTLGGAFALSLQEQEPLPDFCQF